MDIVDAELPRRRRGRIPPQGTRPKSRTGSAAVSRDCPVAAPMETSGMLALASQPCQMSAPGPKGPVMSAQRQRHAIVLKWPIMGDSAACRCVTIKPIVADGPRERKREFIWESAVATHSHERRTPHSGGHLLHFEFERSGQPLQVTDPCEIMGGYKHQSHLTHCRSNNRESVQTGIREVCAPPLPKWQADSCIS